MTFTAHRRLLLYPLLSEELHEALHSGYWLLIPYLLSLLYFLYFKWIGRVDFFSKIRLVPLSDDKRKLNPFAVLVTMSIANFIGVVTMKGVQQ